MFKGFNESTIEYYQAIRKIIVKILIEKIKCYILTV